MLKLWPFISMLCLSLFLEAQEQNPFNGYLPIRESPELNYSSPMIDREPLIFEAEPILYFNLYNSYPFYDTLFDAKKAEAFYLYFNSHFRMFQGRSKPVRMPSYKFFVGWQHSFDLGKGSFSLALETGHYSNGQAGCAWADTAVDGTLSCRRLAQNLGDNENLAKRLNRVNGNFSTNLSKIRLQYVEPKLREEQRFIQRFDLDYTYNHEALFLVFEYEGSADNDNRVIGRHNIQAAYEYIRYTDQNFRYSIRQSAKRIFRAHNSIEPWRFQTTLSIFPKEWITAFFVSYIYGHDNYNIRIVDSGHQFSVGIRWDLFQLEEFR